MNPEIARRFEANQEVGTGVSNDKLGMWIFLASEVIFFAWYLDIQPVRPREDTNYCFC